MTICNGNTAHPAPDTKFPARAHAQRLAKELAALLPAEERSGVSKRFATEVEQSGIEAAR